ncbi:MAG: GDP-mannose 4,6-dehydratase [Deltaproteobacteria bacterium]|nr:GDP-mannose 4,6-dehydratase [Deltaproteobacteria bacterium]MBI2500373.1 GDP-mannose 4,6-dehydratase [Deltaproteobacteria bacterium]
MLNGNEKILVTGGTGQLGSCLIEQLVEGGLKPFVMGRRIERSPILQKLLHDGKILFASVDLMEEAAPIEDALRGFSPETLIHLGSVVDQRSDFFSSSRQTITVNLIGMVHLLQSLPDLKMICYASTTSVYGIPEFLPIDERHPTNPVNTYAASKLAAEKYLTLFSESKGIPAALLRISSVYSELRYAPELQRAIPEYLRAVRDGSDLVVWGKGDAKQDYIYIDDVISAILLSVEKRFNGLLNIATGESHTVQEAAERIRGVDGKSLSIKQKPVDTKAADYAYDIRLARSQIGFSPRYSFEDGLSRCVSALKR